MPTPTPKMGDDDVPFECWGTWSTVGAAEVEVANIGEREVDSATEGSEFSKPKLNNEHYNLLFNE
jgi:hypothetical protein